MTPFVALGLDGIWLFSAQSINAEGLNLRCHQPLGLQRLGPWLENQGSHLNQCRFAQLQHIVQHLSQFTRFTVQMEVVFMHPERVEIERLSWIHRHVNSTLRTLTILLS